MQNGVTGTLTTLNSSQTVSNTDREGMKLMRGPIQVNNRCDK